MKAKAKAYKGRKGPVWRYITDIDNENRVGTCSLCFSRLSFRTTTGNLRQHIEKQHGIVFDSMDNNSENRFNMSKDADQNNTLTDQSDSEQSTSLDPENELWGFFDKEPQKRARCSMCSAVLKRDSDILYKHLKEQHSRISENLEYRDNEENYTEVIYLEDPVNADHTEHTKAKHKSVKLESPESPKPKRPKRRYSYKEPLKANNSQNVPPTQELPKIVKNPHEEEIENFGKYITGILKAVPKEASSKLQMDIVNLVIAAKLKCMEQPMITIHDTIELPDKDNAVEGNEAMEDENPKKETADDTMLENSTRSEGILESRKAPDKPHTTPKRRPKNFNYSEEMSMNVTDQDAKEVDNFGKYVTCLLKSVLNKEVGTKLQMDIVSLIMTARLKIIEKNAPILTLSKTVLINTGGDLPVLAEVNA